MAILGRPCRYAERKVKLVRGVFEVVIYFGEMVVGCVVRRGALPRERFSPMALFGLSAMFELRP
jgi:hypothetical protein